METGADREPVRKTNKLDRSKIYRRALLPFTLIGFGGSLASHSEAGLALNIFGLAGAAILNYDLYIPRSLEIDLTGKHLALPAIPTRERRNFLTPERKQLGQEVVRNIYKRTAKYGVKPFSFSPKHLTIVKDKGPKTSAMVSRLGRITLETADMKTQDNYVNSLAHEYYHTVALQRWSRRPGRDRWGLSFTGIDRKLDWLEEGVVEKSAQISARELNYPNFMGSNNEQVEVVDDMCHYMARRQLEEDLSSFPHETWLGHHEEMTVLRERNFSLFEEAIYGRGRLQPLCTTIQEHYRDLGGVRKFFELVEAVGKSDDNEYLIALQEFAQGREYGNPGMV